MHGAIPAFAEVYDLDQIFAEKAALAKQSAASRQAIIEKVMGATKRGDVVQLSRTYAVGDVNFSQIVDGGSWDRSNEDWTNSLIL